MVWSAVAAAQSTGPIDVTALPLPHASCPGVTVSAVPNDMLLDTPAFACAINLVPATGGEVYIPAGKYHLNDTLSITNKPIAFRGEGQRITNLLWEAVGASGNGINFVSSSGPVNHTLSIKSMSLLRAAGTGGAAINASWQTPTTLASFGGTSATIFDVHISTDPWGQDGQPTIYWNDGIILTNAVGARIHVFNIHGVVISPPPNPQPAISAAIHITGKSIGVSINDGDMGRWNYGVIVSGTSEAVRLEDIETSENHDGYYIASVGKSHVIANCHAGVIYQNGIRLVNTSDVILTENFMISVTPGFTGIHISNPGLPGTGFQVRGNFVSTGSPDMHGFRLAGAISNSIVMGNITEVGGNAIVLTDLPGVGGGDGVDRCRQSLLR